MWWRDAQTRLVDGIVILDLQAEVSMEEGNNRLREQVEQLLNDSHREMLLNFERIRYLDSKGAGDVIGCYLAVTRKGGRLKLINVPPMMRRLFERMRLDMIEICESEQTALRSFEGNLR
jgi:anti-sigma B factor antagonist